MTTLDGTSTSTAGPQEAASGPAATNFIQSLMPRLFAPVDIAPLVYVRIIFGAVMFWEVRRYFQNGWIGSFYSAPTFHFTYYGFEWVKPWPGDGMQMHFFALGLLSACIVAGFCYRIAAALFFAGFTYVFLLDEVRYLNHFYLICLISFLLIFVPAERAVSVDAWLRPKLRSSVAPAWALWLLRAQIGIPYFFGGIAKLNADWLQGEPMRLWLARRMDFPLIGPWFQEEWMVYFFVLGGLLLDLLIVPLLLWRRTRAMAFAGAVLFHLLNARLFSIGIFPWLMLAATIIFFPPEVPRRLLTAAGLQPPAVSSSTPVWTVISTRQPVIAGLLFSYLLFQVLMPLRHFAYPGVVHWTEQGHRFSWHMKLRSKRGEARFHITDPATGQSWTVDPATHLTPRQVEKMATHPDMILQFSHHLAAVSRRAGHPPVQVRADVHVSLNGRPPRRLIDPSVNLAAVPRSLRPADWILPLTEPLRRSQAGDAIGIEE